MRITTLLPTLAAAALAVAIAAAPASADSIVYAKRGNLFLTSPDGSKGYQLTSDGGYSSPSQADNGIIGAVRNGQLVRLDRSGRALNAPIAAMGSPGRASSRSIGGPYEPRISPDGTRFAYYFYVQTSWDDLELDIRWIDTGSYGTWTYADRFTSPVTESEYEKSLTQTEWVTNDRLLGTMGMFMNMWTWKLGTGHGYTYDAAQWWFGLQDPPDEWGVPAYHWYDDPALSRDGSRLAMTDSGQQLVVAATNGPAWSGEPPYPEPDYVAAESGFAEPTITCRVGSGGVTNPSWSRDGGTLAYGAADGVHALSVSGAIDCSQDRVIAPGGTEPAFGLADVDMAQAPKSAPAAAQAPAALTVSRVALRPRTFRARRGARVTYTLSAPARVTLTITSSRGKRVKGAIRANGMAGRNSLRLRKKSLKPGSYRLLLTAAPRGGGSKTAGSATFRIVR